MGSLVSRQSLPNRSHAVRGEATGEVIALIVALFAALSVSLPMPSPGVAEDIWFRESLRAISDWEDLLAAWETEVDEADRVPSFPVPADGTTVAWPNPLPARLIPSQAPALPLQLDYTRAGEDIVGYHHPGGGGADRWYHPYERKFDRLCSFVPRVAPFRLDLAGPREWLRGENTLEFTLASATDAPIAVEVLLELRTPGAGPIVLTRTVELAAGEEAQVSLPVALDEPGGGLLLLRLRVDEQAWFVPLLTHVEDAERALASVRQILAEHPDAQGTARLAEVERLAAGATGERWREAFLAASQLREELLLSRIDFDELLLLQRKPFDSEQPFMDAHHLPNRPGGGIYRLAPVSPEGKLRPVVENLGEGVYRDLCLDWDASRMLFSFGNGSDKWNDPLSYHIWEVATDGSGLRQLTEGPRNDCEPFYLPNGQIGFTSDRSGHIVMCGGDRHAPTLHIMESDGSHPRLLSANVFNDFNPTVMPDGRILYSRWEYNERSVTSLHNPFTMNPDGTMVMPFYGNATWKPNVVMFPRPVPGSSKVMGLFTAHHGQTHGAVGLIDTGRGVDGDAPLTLLTPEVPVTGEHHLDSRGGWFSDPWPLSEETFLANYTPTVVPWLEWTWALYVSDRHGNLALVSRAPGISLAEPVPLRPRPRPLERAPAPRDCDSETASAEVLLQDVAIGLRDVPPGTVRSLRVLEDVPRVGLLEGGVITTSGTSIYTVKRILGTVPVAADGSARIELPANRNVYFEALDAEGREVQRMRSVVCLKPGERRTCIGCHEPRNSAPPLRSLEALRSRASAPAPPPWGERTLSYLRDVQPVLDAQCLGCHAHARERNRVILTGDLTDQFCVSYQELLPYLRVANAMRWDHPDDVLAQPPWTYGSRVSPLMRMLDEGHHGVRLTPEDDLRLATWIDANAVYYDRYEWARRPDRRIFVDEPRARLDEIHARRCADCHGDSDGTGGTWRLSLDRFETAGSRMLIAPLARSAGGWQRCGEAVFATTDDPDYSAALAALEEVRAALREAPRADLLSLVGDPAEDARPTLPTPPESVTRTPALEEGALPLDGLPWLSGEAGWTANGDLLPRIGRDVEDRPCVFGMMRIEHAIGTHAPSTIAWSLPEGYSRFRAGACGGEDGGSVVFELWGDGTLLWRSAILRGRLAHEECDRGIAGVRRLDLVVGDAGDGYVADMATWLSPRLIP